MPFKILTDGCSPYVPSFAWPLPVEDGSGGWLPGDWIDHEGNLVPGHKGLHLTTADPYHSLWTTWGMSAFAAETRGETRASLDGIVAQSVRLLEPTPPPAWWNESTTALDRLGSLTWPVTQPVVVPDWIIVEDDDRERLVQRMLADGNRFPCSGIDPAEVAKRVAAILGCTVAVEVLMGRARGLVESSFRDWEDRRPDTLHVGVYATAVDNAEAARGMVAVLAMAQAIQDAPELDLDPDDRGYIIDTAPLAREALEFMRAGYDVRRWDEPHRGAYGWLYRPS